MEPFVIGLIGVAVLFVLLFAGVHVGVALGVVGTAGLLVLMGFDKTLSLISTASFYYTNSASLLVMPCFMFMSCLAADTGIASNAFASLSKLVGRFPAGLGVANCCATTIFGMVTGSAASTSTIFTKTAVPVLRKYGYEKRFTYGLVCSSGLTGMLIPPSVLIVFWGLNTGDSIGTLLMAGIGPGLLLNFLFCACAVVMVLLKPALAPRIETKYTAKQRLRAVFDLWPIGVIGATIIGGIYGGVFTASEAGAWGVIFVIIMGLIQKTISWKMFWNSCKETVGIMSMMFLILIAGNIFARFLTLTGVSQVIVSYIVTTVADPRLLLAALVVLYLILGCFLDAMSIVCLTVPIAYPMITALGIDPIWFAMVAVLALHAGMLTPPLGMCVFASAAVAEPDVKLGDIFIGALPFLGMVVLCTLLTIFIPGVATWLPSNIG